MSTNVASGKWKLSLDTQSKLADGNHHGFVKRRAGGIVEWGLSLLGEKLGE
jgi:hypothetical protein